MSRSRRRAERPELSLPRSCRSRATSKAREETAGHPLGIYEFQTGALRERPQLLLRHSVRITRKLGDCKQASGPQHARDRGETRLRIGDFAEHGHQERNVERAGAKGQRDGIRLGVACVSDAGPAQAASCLLEHFDLDVYELEPPVGNGSSHIDAEETWPWPHLQDTGCSSEMKVADQRLR
jgi:hypothetical protein